MITIGAQQPYFLPDFYYFYKIARSEMFIVADFLKFRKQSPIVRTKISADHYLTIPVIHQKNPHPLIKNIEMAQTEDWQRIHLRTLESNFHKYPYFEYYFPELVSLYERSGNQLNKFLKSLLHWQMKLLFSDKNVIFASAEGIENLAHLKSRLEKIEFPTFLHYPEEKNYYHKHFPEIPLQKIQVPSDIDFPADYHPSLSLILLLFLNGPETILYLKKE